MITYEKQPFDSNFVECLLRLSSKYRITQNVTWEAFEERIIFFVFVEHRFGAGARASDAICVYDLPLLEQCLTDSSRFGIELFFYRKIGAKPDESFFTQFTDEEAKHFNGCETYIDPKTAKPFPKRMESCNTP